MNDSEKRRSLGKILQTPQGIIAPGISEPIFARLAEDCGYTAIHLSGNALHKSYCLPDQNLVTLQEIESKVARISDVTSIPLIVDIGGDHRGPAHLERAVRVLERAGAAAVRIEDSYSEYDGGAIGQTKVVSADVMVDRIKRAADSRRDLSLAIIARCDTRPFESLDSVLERLGRYGAAGADALGVQLSDALEFKKVGGACAKPLVSLWPRNLMTAIEFFASGFRIALLPSSVALSAVGAARELLKELQRTGSDREYFQRVHDRQGAQDWYRRLGNSGGRK